MCQSAHTSVRGQLVKVSSLFPLCGFGKKKYKVLGLGGKHLYPQNYLVWLGPLLLRQKLRMSRAPV